MTDLSLLEDFIPETVEHLEELEDSLLALEADPGDGKVLGNLFRSAHTIKGSAEYLGLKCIATIAHRLENLLDILHQGERSPDARLLDTLMESRDRIAALVADLQNHREERTPIEDLVERIDALHRGVAGATPDGRGDDLLDLGQELAALARREEFLASPSLEELEADLVEEAFRDGLDDHDPLAPATDGEPPEDLRAGGDGEDVEPGSRAVVSLPDEGAEAYDEEYDDELFRIFVEHLRENLGGVEKLALGLAGSPAPREVLLECQVRVESLRNSSAYMDYRKLADFYEGWSTQIAEAADRLDLGSRPGFGFMDDCIAQVRKRFGRWLEREPADSAPAPPEIEAEASAETAGEEDALLEQAPSLFEPEEPPPGATQGLFDELDSVFDATGAPGAEEDQEPDPFSRDLDEVLVGKAAAPDGREPGKPGGGLAQDAGTGPSRPVSAQPPEAGIPSPACLDREQAVAQEPARPDEACGAREAGKSETRVGERAVKQNLRVDAGKIDLLMNQVGELVVSRASYAQLYSDMREFQHRLQRMGLDARELKWVRNLTFRLSEATVALGRTANDLQEGVMKIRMLPISQLFNRYPRLVRDLVHNTGKKVDLVVQGEETELDKMVIEEIADPLVHIIRNAVDHGVETVEERRALGKPEMATVRLESFHESNHVVVEITDDGRGMDPGEIRAAALQKGLATREELSRMREKEILALVMIPGFSTSKTVTTTSGRGVGMDVVKKNVEKLNGTVELDSEPGAGTRVRIKIPLTLAIIQALLVRVGGEVFTIPLSVVEETLRIREDRITTIEGVEVIQLREGVLSLLRLSDEFGKQAVAPVDSQAYVVVVNTGMRQVGLVVDSLIGQEEAVIKPLADFLQERSGFSGATILGDGRVSLILDVYELVNLCMCRRVEKRRGPDREWDPPAAADPLGVEDTIH